MLKAIVECITGPADNTVNEKAAGSYVSKVTQCTSAPEKTTFNRGQTDQLTAQDAAAAALFSALRNAEKPGRDLNTAIDDITCQSGLTERIAVGVFNALQHALKEGSPMREAMSEAFKKANDAATAIFGFAHDHPIICAIIALGILMLLAPTIIHVLGFSALGPVEGESSLTIQFDPWLTGKKGLSLQLGSRPMVDT